MLFMSLQGRAQVLYSEFFTGERLRYDYIVAGNNEYMQVYDHQFVHEPVWGGSKVNLIDTFRYGEMFVEISDSASGQVIYSRGFSSLFKEWQTVKEAKNRKLAFKESLIMPFPRQTVKLKIYERDSLLNFQQVHSTYLNPAITGIKYVNSREGITIRNLMISGLPPEKIDIAIISEGYTSAEEDFFLQAARRSMEHFFSWEPYKSLKDKFNFYAVFIPSLQSGTDIPDSLWKSTAINTSFYTFGSERYLTTSDISGLREIASEVPYDQLCVLVNTEKYGGGGVYNSFTVFSAENEFSEFLFLHEFGHGFAGLADEYYTSPTAYEELAPVYIEPYQPNITTRVNFQSKWEDMIDDSIPLPTPNNEQYTNVTGLFEGAAYQSTGFYRPAFDCAMKSKTCKHFCPVCQRAIERMIRFNCGE